MNVVIANFHLVYNRETIVLITAYALSRHPSINLLSGLRMQKATHAGGLYKSLTVFLAAA